MMNFTCSRTLRRGARSKNAFGRSSRRSTEQQPHRRKITADLCRVSYVECTADGLLRHVVCLGAKISWPATCAAAHLMLAILDGRVGQLPVDQNGSTLNYGQVNHQKT